MKKTIVSEIIHQDRKQRNHRNSRFSSAKINCPQDGGCESNRVATTGPGKNARQNEKKYENRKKNLLPRQLRNEGKKRISEKKKLNVGYTAEKKEKREKTESTREQAGESAKREN